MRTLDSFGKAALVGLPRSLGLDLEEAEPLRRHLLPLDTEALLERARCDTQLDDFGDVRFRRGLDLLLESYEADAALNFIGRIAARYDVLRLLKTRLRLEADRKAFPGIAEERIVRPIFITGLPRSGTTLLHNLLAQDPANRVPLAWEVMFPSPPGRAAFDADPRIAKTDKALRWLDCLAPGFRAIHPLGAQDAQECIEITVYAFESPRFHTIHNTASYQAWLTNHIQDAAYAFHRRMLQHLQSLRRGERWVLKAPAHLFALDLILKVYPDARIIQTHRDPLEVMPSTASLTAALRSAFSNKIDRTAIGVEVMERWADGLQRAIEFRDAHAEHELVYDVWYRDLLFDPIETVQHIYWRFDLNWTSEVDARMRRYLSKNLQNKHGTHRYTLDEFGLIPEDVIRRFQSYYDRFLAGSRKERLAARA